MRHHLRLSNSVMTVLAIVMATLLIWGCSESNEITSPNNNEAETDVLDIPVPETAQEEAELQRGISEFDAQFAKAAFWTEITGPTTITEPGFYRVTSDFSAADDAIVIQSDNVYLLMHGHTITGPGNKMGRCVVVEDAQRVFILGGEVVNFGLGVQLINSRACWVSGFHVVGGDEFADPANGIAPQIGIMAVNSRNNVINNNKLELINLGIFMRGGGTFHNRLYKNHVRGGENGLLGICYNPDGSGDPDGAHDDLILRNVLDRFGAGIQFNTTSPNNRFIANHVRYFNVPWEDLNGNNHFAHNITEQIDPPMMADLTLEFDGIEDLGPDFAYEGWIVVNGSPISTGVFTVDGSGNQSQTVFSVNAMQLEQATKFVLTIEPMPDADPAPSATHYLAGDFTNGHADLTVNDPAALGSDFMAAMGEYILNTPTTGSDDSDYNQGIWWLDPAAGPGATLDLPTLPAGWAYEGWVVGPGGPVTTGRFLSASGADFDGAGPTSGPDGFPPFPGQDYINPPMDLIGYAAVITIEPEVDNSPAPFTLKPLVDGDIEDVGIGVLQGMGNNAASFPTGTAVR